MVVLPEQRRNSNPPAHLPGHLDPPIPTPPNRLCNAQMDPTD